MALYNLAKMGTSTTGTGTVTLGVAKTGFLSFASAGVPDGATVTYAIKDGANSEIGRGVYTSSGTTLTRATILRSTNSNNAINLSGTSDIEVGITASAEDFSDCDMVASVNTGPIAGRRNRLINGTFAINQRLATSISDDTYCFDRWYVLTQTAAITVGAQTNIENTWPTAIRLTQSQASAQRMGIAQIIESSNCIDLRGKQVTLSARVQLSASGQTLRYAVLEWTGTADTVTSDWVNNWTSSTYTAGNFFTSTSTTVAGTGSTALSASTPTTVSVTATISSSANNIAVMFWTDGTQAQNVTLDIGKAQLEVGAKASSFEFSHRDVELALCQRYYAKSYALSTAPGTATTANQIATGAAQTSVTAIWGYTFLVEMRASPTFTIYNPNSGSSGSAYNASAGTDRTLSATFGLGTKGLSGLTFTTTVSGGDTVTFHYTADAEL